MDPKNSTSTNDSGDEPSTSKESVGTVVSEQTSTQAKTPFTADPPVLPAAENQVIITPMRRRFGFLGEARAYLVEYLIVLISTGVLLGVVVSMLNTILKYNDDSSGYFSSFAYTISISMIATLVVVIPLVLVLTKRTNAVEAAAPRVKSCGWRKGFLGFFLLNVGLWGIGFAITFVYDLISYFASFGLSDDKAFPWRSLLANGITTGLLAFTFWLYSHDYRNQQTSKTRLSRVLNYSLIICAIVLTVIYLGTSFRGQRASFIDDTISGDLTSIQTKISDYQYAHQDRLPNNLDSLSLNDQQKARAEKYDYSYSKSYSGYELCAVFRTDTRSKNKGSQNSLEAASASSSDSYSTAPDNSDPQIHGKDKQCFTTPSYSTGYDDTQLKLDAPAPDSTSTRSN